VFESTFIEVERERNKPKIIIGYLDGWNTGSPFSSKAPKVSYKIIPIDLAKLKYELESEKRHGLDPLRLPKSSYPV